MNIVLGSTSAHKISAAKHACTALGLSWDVSGENIPSGNNEQSIGFEETYRGALHRARSVREKYPATIALGIENGVTFLGSEPDRKHAIDVAVVVLLAPDGREYAATSLGIEVPRECVEEAKRRGFETTTISSVFSERYGGDPTDPQTVLTDGRFPRSKMLEDAIVSAMIAMLRAEEKSA
ncbi:MAG TPA: DUF84 family protein [Candidatus Fimivivens sp.]|nr:DUF84 family protein [Candidatus Fimivivens sp.]